MEINKLHKSKDKLILITDRPLNERVIREFPPELESVAQGGAFYYRFEQYPNSCFALRALMKASKGRLTSTEEAAAIVEYKANLATPPELSLYKTGAHVLISCPPLSHYLEILKVIGARDIGMREYTVPIARAFDVIRAIDAMKSFLPGFAVTKELEAEIMDPLEQFDGTIASIFDVPISEIHAANSAYRVQPENFNNLGYNTVSDFLIKQPLRYIDKSQLTSFHDLEKGYPVVWVGEIVDSKVVFYKHMQFTIRVGNTDFKCMFYNRTWMQGKFNAGDEVLLMGEYKSKNEITGQSLETLTEAKSLEIVPIYSQSQKNNITSKIILNCVYESIERIRPHAKELASYIKRSEDEMSLGKAIHEMHFPSSSYSYIEALETLALYEMTYMQLMIIDKKATTIKDKGIPKPYRQNGYYDALLNSFPYKLTGAQEHGMVKINEFMTTPTAEQVLLTADTGSGKSTVAFLAAMQALDNGYQSVIAGPTDILASQLYDTLARTIDNMGNAKRPTIAYLGGKMKAAEKRDILKAVKDGDIDVLVGTHSVLNDKIEYRNLGLIIIDEQQKFGRAQRESLLESRKDGLKPDILSQTATPIPQSTAQAFYGDIDIIQLEGKPEGRIEVITEWIKDNPTKVTKDKSHKMWGDIKKEIDKGHQVFVVVPMVVESKKIDAASVEGTYKDLNKIMPEVNIGFTHGSLKKDDQRSAMEAFRNNETSILVASTIVEVGVDVPNATRMVVLSADRMGASSLHQIRGRVGRSNLPSKAYLVSEGATTSSKSRLQALVDSNNGFDIALVDMKTRGEGDIFGLRQSGETGLRFASLVDHSKILNEAQSLAQSIYNSDAKDVAIRDAKAILITEEEE